jgi:nucleotide-binding universal stress UspA family protein
MYRNILVPIDLSEQNAPAVNAAREFARAGAATITLLHVIETIRDVPFEELDEFYASLRKKAEQAIERWAADLRGLDVRREIVFGRRGVEIVRYADEHRSDLIVLTSHALEPERPGHGFGTVSQQVALFAPCPVLLVR